MQHQIVRNVLVSVIALALIVPLALAVAEEGKKPKTPKVKGPYAKLDLNDEQNAKIGEIQFEITQKIKALQAEEKTRIEVVLTAEQQEKLKEIQGQAKAEKADKEKADKPKDDKD